MKKDPINKDIHRMKNIIPNHDLVGFSTIVYRYLIFGVVLNCSYLNWLAFFGVVGIESSSMTLVPNKFLFISEFCL